MTADVIALRAHLVAEAERAKRESERCEARDDEAIVAGIICDELATQARTATDAWLAADARLRALDGLIARAT